MAKTIDNKTIETFPGKKINDQSIDLLLEEFSKIKLRFDPKKSVKEKYNCNVKNYVYPLDLKTEENYNLLSLVNENITVTLEDKSRWVSTAQRGLIGDTRGYDVFQLEYIFEGEGNRSYKVNEQIQKIVQGIYGYNLIDKSDLLKKEDVAFLLDKKDITDKEFEAYKEKKRTK
jgi:hypothetical protein